MAVLELAETEAREVRLSQLDIIIDPKPEWNQFEPHVFVRLSVGKTVNGEFVKMYDKEIRYKGAAVYAFIAAFQDLDTRFFQHVIDSGELVGTIK